MFANDGQFPHVHALFDERPVGNAAAFKLVSECAIGRVGLYELIRLSKGVSVIAGPLVVPCIHHHVRSDGIQLNARAGSCAGGKLGVRS